MKDIHALTDKNIIPDDTILESVLKTAYPIYQATITALAKESVTPEYRYYKDGKAWMGKLIFKKKNIGWLHVYHNKFRVTCYFTNKQIPQIETSDIADKIKENFFKSDNKSKLIPMTIEINTDEDINNMLKVLSLKK